jgi:hypothetical protein
MPEAVSAPVPDPAAAASPDAFLGSLVDAMRGVVDSARDDSLRQARAAVEERMAAMKTESAARADELRQRSDTDITSFEDWSRAETDRIRAETERKIEQRRQKLVDQLAEHERRSAAEVATWESRLADHETALASFFADLNSIKDPAAFIAAARRMPALPTMSASESATEAESSSSDPVAGKGDPKSAAKAAASAAATDDSLSSRLRDLGLGSTETETEVADATDSPAASTSDAKPATPTTPATAAPATGEPAVSDVVAQGLASFGAVTALKQSLAAMEGVTGVTLSLGPGGEFMYRINHAAAFDVEAALRTAQPDATVQRAADGTFRVAVGTGS